MKATPSPTKSTVKAFTTPKQYSAKRRNSESPPSENSQSPFKQFKECIDNPHLSEIRKSQIHDLFILFMYYTSYGDKLNLTLLSHSNYVRMMKDADIFNNGAFADLDLIYKKYSKTKSKMSFNDFTNSLVDLSHIICQAMYKQQEIENMIKIYFIPLLQLKLKEIAQSNISPIVVAKSIPYSVKDIFASIEPVLHKIYMKHYPFEKDTTITEDELFKLSISATYQLLMDYDICPGIISKPLSFYLIQHTLYNETDQIAVTTKVNDGKFFTFAKFIELIVRLSIYSRQAYACSLFGRIVNRKHC